MHWHPDRSKAPDAEERFKEIAKAYAILSDSKKRAKYDARGFEGISHYSHDDLFRGVDLGSIFGDLGFGPGGESIFDRFFRQRTSRSARGGMGSTAGGIKILRLLLLLRLLQLVIRRTCMPSHAVLDPWLGRHRLAGGEVEHALLIIMLFIVVILLSWFPFLLMGYAPLDPLFEVVSATANVGLSCGITAPELPTTLKGVLCLDMLLGRLEVVALVLVLYPWTWFGKRSQ